MSIICLCHLEFDKTKTNIATQLGEISYKPDKALTNLFYWWYGTKLAQYPRWSCSPSSVCPICSPKNNQQEHTIVWYYFQSVQATWMPISSYYKKSRHKKTEAASLACVCSLLAVSSAWLISWITLLTISTSKTFILRLHLAHPCNGWATLMMNSYFWTKQESALFDTT